MQKKLVKEGQGFVGPVVDARGVIQKYLLQVGQAESLASMVEDYAFFTPAPMYLYGGFTDAPLIDLMYEVRTDIKLFHRKFASPIFRGLEVPGTGNADWNRVLWAVHRQHWDWLHDFLLSCTMSDRDNKRLIGYGTQELTVIDPLAMDRSIFYKAGHTLQVTAFGVNASHGRAAFVVGSSPLMEPPTLRFFPPDPEMLTAANALFSGGNPVNARASYRKWKEKRDADSRRDESQRGGNARAG